MDVQYHERDRYGRTVGEVILPDGSNLNALIVRRAYRRYSKKFIPEEEEAKANRRGLWKDRNPIPPWEFRRNKELILNR